MPTVAEQLSNAGEKHSLSIQQVAQLTNIKSEHIRALEGSDYDVFSAPIYIRGFVRSIARILKMDVQSVMTQLDAELAATENFKEPPSLTMGPKSPIDRVMYLLTRVQWRIALPVIIVVGVIWIAVASMKSNNQAEAPPREPNVGPGLFEPNESGGDTLEIPEI